MDDLNTIESLIDNQRLIKPIDQATVHRICSGQVIKIFYNTNSLLETF